MPKTDLPFDSGDYAPVADPTGLTPCEPGEKSHAHTFNFPLIVLVHGCKDNFGFDGWSLGGDVGGGGGIGFPGGPDAAALEIDLGEFFSGPAAQREAPNSQSGPTHPHAALARNLGKCAMQRYGVSSAWKVPVAASGLPIWSKERGARYLGGASDRMTTAAKLQQMLIHSYGWDPKMPVNVFGTRRSLVALGRASYYGTIAFIASTSSICRVA